MTRRIAAQTVVELRLALRQGERVLVMVGIPLAVLVFFARVDVVSYGSLHPLGFLVPGVLALAVVSTAMVSLGIATGFERGTGVLRRLGVTPLGRGGLLAAKALSVVVLEAMQAAVLVGTGLAMGWRPGGPAPAAVPLALLGTAAFAGLGFALAGRLRPEANLAVANGLFLLLLLVGGVVVPVSRLPGPLQAVTRALPAEPLASGLRAALGGGQVPGRVWVVLAAWAVGACALAALTFRWD